MALLEKLKNLLSTPRTYEKVGRNDPCPCGSGKKFKHCHFEEVDSAKVAEQNAHLAKKSPLDSAARALNRMRKQRAKPK